MAKTVLISNGIIGYFQEFWAFGGVPVAGSQTLDFNNGIWQKVSLTGDMNLTLSNGKSGTSYLIRVEQGHLGPYQITFTNVDWGNVGAPNHKLDVKEGTWLMVGIYCDGTKYYGSWGNEYISPWFP